MANQTIPQTAEFCKVQNNPKVNIIINRMLHSHEQHYKECGEILAMGNDAAVEFLRSVGFGQVIPGTHFATLYDVADFFNMDQDSLYGYLTRTGFGRVREPKESLSVELCSFFKRAGLLEHGEIVSRGDDGSGVFDFRFNAIDAHFITTHRWSQRMFSARAYLCVLPLIRKWYRNKYPDAQVVWLYDKLMEFMTTLKAAPTEVHTSDTVAAPAESGTTLSKDELFEMVKRAVREVMSEAKVELSAPITITT